VRFLTLELPTPPKKQNKQQLGFLIRTLVCFLLIYMKMLGYESIGDGCSYEPERTCSARLIDTIDLEVRPIIKVARKKRGTFFSRTHKDKPPLSTEGKETTDSIEISSREPPTSPEPKISPQNEANPPHKQQREGFLDRLLKRSSHTQYQKAKRQGAITDSHSHSLPQLHLDTQNKDGKPNSHAPHMIRRTKSATTCAYPDCKKLGGYNNCVKHCTTCFRAVYCSEYCKIEHWPTHKLDCKEPPTPTLI